MQKRYIMTWNREDMDPTTNSLMQPKRQPPDGVERAPAIQHLVSISQNAQSQGNAIFLATGQVLTF